MPNVDAGGVAPRFAKHVAGLPAGASAGRVPTVLALSRGTLFSGLVLIGFLNGISEKLYKGIAEAGVLRSALATFDVSVILWGACAAAIWMLKRAGDRGQASTLDFAVTGIAAAMFLVPVPPLSWLALSGVAVYLYLASPSDDDIRRAAAILFALTIPPFWARLLFAAMRDLILRVDAVLVGWIVGTAPVGNVVPLADGSGSLFIGPSCSSLGNVSLAVLTAVVAVNIYNERWSPRTLFWTACACFSVVALNVLRMAAIGFFPDHYELIHGPVGATVAGWLTVGAVLWITLHGIGRDDPRLA